MSQEEISRVATTDARPDLAPHRTPAPAHRASPHAHTADDIWNAVQRLGTQVAAAKELGISQSAVQSGLRRHMKTHGLAGQLPGLMQIHRPRKPKATDTPAALAIVPAAWPGEPSATPARKIQHKFAAVYEPLEQQAHRDNGFAQGITEGLRSGEFRAATAEMRERVETGATGDTRSTWRAQSAIELSERQAALVLEAVGASEVVERLREHGYELTVRLRAEAAA